MVLQTGYEIAKAAVEHARKVLVVDDDASTAVCAAIGRVIGKRRYLDPDARFSKADRLLLLAETERQVAKMIADRGLN